MELIYRLPNHIRITPSGEGERPIVHSALYNAQRIRQEIENEQTQQAPSIAELQALGIAAKQA